MTGWLYILLACFFSITVKAQDTLFLKREQRSEPYPFYHAIFIDTASTFKRPLLRFDQNNYDSATYKSELHELKQVHRIHIPEMPRRWIMLHRYKGAYWLYSPSEWGGHYRFMITDSTTADFTMEGPEPSALRSIIRKGPGHWVIKRTNYWKGETVDIQMIDPAKGVAIFHFSPTRFQKKPYAIYMVDVAKAMQFPVIVNYCVTDKQDEFEFDPVR